MVGVNAASVLVHPDLVLNIRVHAFASFGVVSVGPNAA
jgi:hypothetical protein